MADARQIPWDWLSAQQRLGQGRVSDPSQDRLSASSTPDWWWQQQRYRERQTPGLIGRPEDVEALPFGDIADPVSQAAFLAAPGMVRGSKALLETMAQPGPSRLMRPGMLAGERGNLGPPPVSATGEALPESMVRDETGQLQRLYHGTSRVFPDFDMAQSGSGAGGDLYGPGIYMTANPGIGSSYAKAGKTTMTDIGQLQDHFAPGNIVQSYGGGRDKVLAFDPGEGGTWKVQVQAVDNAGLPVRGEPPRWHRTAPQVDLQPNVRPVYADLKRPFDIDSELSMQQRAGIADWLERQAMSPEHNNFAGKRAASFVEKLHDPSFDWAGDQAYLWLSSALGGSKEQTAKALQELGYDGITHLGGKMTGGQPHRVYIAFSPDQVYPSVNVDALRNLSTQYPPP